MYFNSLDCNYDHYLSFYKEVLMCLTTLQIVCEVWILKFKVVIVVKHRLRQVIITEVRSVKSKLIIWSMAKNTTKKVWKGEYDDQWFQGFKRILLWWSCTETVSLMKLSACSEDHISSFNLCGPSASRIPRRTLVGDVQLLWLSHFCHLKRDDVVWIGEQAFNDWYLQFNYHYGGHEYGV